jgi:signal transduction histidine kinase
VAHEIRNPLTSIKMWLYSLRRSIGPSAEVQQKIDIVSDEVTRLENIVHHFLEFSRPPQLELSTQSVRPLLDKTIELIRHQLDKHGIEVIRQDDRELPEVKADREQLKQVFLNLINNAMEAMPGGGKIHISTARTCYAGRDVVVVRLSDTGPGMPQYVQQRIFEPFFTTKEQGTGLGTCIAASIMARHGGALILESSNSNGTTWAVRITTDS